MTQQIKKAGLKVTGPRMKILEIMAHETSENDVHLSAEDVYKILIREDEDIGLATVYRVLTQFEQAGILKRHNFVGNHSVFEINNGDNHDHLVCVRSGKTVEFNNAEIDRLQRKVAAEHGYILEDRSVVLYGIYDPERAQEFLAKQQEQAQEQPAMQPQNQTQAPHHP